MDLARLNNDLQSLMGQSLVHHGYSQCTRDYELYVYPTADDGRRRDPECLRYRFQHCVHSEVDTAVPVSVWSRALVEGSDDESTSAVEGYVGYTWGTSWPVLYPGARLVAHSARARQWTERMDVDFHEVHVETNGQELWLVFAALSVTIVYPGFSPFVIPPPRPHE